MNNQLSNNKSSAFSISDYYAAKTTDNISHIYFTIPRNKGNVDFDIYDYEMLFNDEKTKNIIRNGKTIGCFYIESPGMRSLLRKLNCDTFEMLTAASSVIRPGVAESGMMQEFVARHKNPGRRKYLFSAMEKHLGETYGVMIYQEDVIKIAHHIAGLSLVEADLLRRAMSGKLRSRTAMKRISDHFFFSCKKNGLDNNTAHELWRQIKSFAGYAFCKAHSASFALLSFQVAYLKAHYPAEFMASVLSNSGGYYSAAVYINEIKRLNFKILLPCVNLSKSEYTVAENGKSVRIGFMAIKNLTKYAVDKIIAERKRNGRYISLSDFIIRTRLNYEEIKILIRCGSMETFEQTRPTLMRLLDVYISHRKLLDESYDDLFAYESFNLEKSVVTMQEYSDEEKCSAEYEIFGYMITKHPLDFFARIINTDKIVHASEMINFNGGKIKMAGWYMAAKRIKTKNGNVMKFLSLEDLTGTFEAVLFPKTYSRYAEKTMSMGPYLLEGKVDTAGGNNLIVEKLKVLSNIHTAPPTQKDSTGNKYLGDVEKITEDEVTLVSSLGKERLRVAYL